MSKVAQYLQEHLNGEVTDSLKVREYFARDASILTLTPSVVAFPFDENDIRKIARFSWQLAERGQQLPITVRGGGTDTSGAAIGSGVVVITTRHMNELVALDAKKAVAIVQPGITFDQLERVIRSHGLSLPPQPGTARIATIGGGLANNSVGPKSLKYGSIADYVESLRVVLANGEVIETHKLNRRSLSHKLGLTTFEGEIYRQLDALLEENAELIEKNWPVLGAVFNNAGYNLAAVKHGSDFDLTPLFIGSQGSLGLVTEASLRLEPLNQTISTALMSFETMEAFEAALLKILDLNPSQLEMINRPALQQAVRLNPARFQKVVSHPAAAIHLIAEFDNFKESDQKRLQKSLKRVTEKAGGSFSMPKSDEDITNLQKLLTTSGGVLRHSEGQSRAVPVAEDLSLPVEKLAEFMRQAGEQYQSLGLEPAMWGSAGSGLVYMRPRLVLAEIGDRQRMFKIIDGLYRLAIDLGGSPTASAGDGRLRVQQSQQLYGKDLHGLMLKIKQIFDPRGILNPGVKTAGLEDMKSMIADDYDIGRYEQHITL